MTFDCSENGMSMINEKYIHSEITSNILAAAFEVHSTLGCGFVESLYHKALLRELYLHKIDHESEKELPIYYKNQKVGARRADILINKQVIIELKAVSQLENIHLAQAINYLETFNLDVGLLLNFGSRKLEYKRVIHPKFLRNNNHLNPI